MPEDIGIHVSVVEAAESDIKKEGRFTTLNQLGFVRTESEKEQWLLLINDAWKAVKLPENELVRDYLALMLWSYTRQIDIYDELKTFNYLERVLSADFIADDVMQKMADISLQYVAFVPHRSRNRNNPRSLSYSYELGEILYQHLALRHEEKEGFWSSAFREMSNCFGTAVMVLRSVKLPFQNMPLVTEAWEFPTDEEARGVAQRLIMILESATASA